MRGMSNFGGMFGYGGLGAIFGILSILIILVILLFVANVAKGKSRRSSVSLILEEFSLNEKEIEFLIIKGRVSGFWNWILSLFNKAPTIRFSCNKQAVKLEASSINDFFPLANITCISSGMLKSSVALLVIGVIVILSGFFLPGPTKIIEIILGVVLIIIWAMNRNTIYFGICIAENKPKVTISLKRGIIGSITKEKVELAANVLKEAVLAYTKAK